MNRMYVKKLTILSLCWVFAISYPYNSFALFKANIDTENNKIDINENVRLNISIESDELSDIKMWNIKWLYENFDVVWQSQSQWSSTQVVIQNWKTEEKTSISHRLTLELKPKKKWNYEIWPASIFNWSWKIETNSIKIEVSWDKLFVNGNHLQVPTWNNSKVQTQVPQENKDETLNFEKEIEKKQFNDSQNLILFLIISLSVWVWIYFIIYNAKRKNVVSNNTIKSDKIIKQEEINYEIQNNETIYPEISDNNFIEKIDYILRDKLRHKYNIKDIENKTYEEIMETIKDKEDLKIIIDKLIKAKYSNLVNDNSSLINLIKNL